MNSIAAKVVPGNRINSFLPIRLNFRQQEHLRRRAEWQMRVGTPGWTMQTKDRAWVMSSALHLQMMCHHATTACSLPSGCARILGDTINKNTQKGLEQTALHCQGPGSKIGMNKHSHWQIKHAHRVFPCHQALADKLLQFWCVTKQKPLDYFTSGEREKVTKGCGCNITKVANQSQAFMPY